MIQAIVKNINKQPLFFLIYTVFLLFLMIVLFSFTKQEATLWANQYWTPFQDVLYKYMTYLGDFGMATAVIIALLFWKLKYAVIAIICFGSTAGTTQFFKKVVYHDVHRPLIEMHEEIKEGKLHFVEGVDQLIGHSFPSGHTTSAFSIFCFLALLSKKKWVGLFCVVLAIMIGYSRIYLCQHFYEDVFVGSLIGTMGSLLFFSFFENKQFGHWGEKSILSLK